MSEISYLQPALRVLSRLRQLGAGAEQGVPLAALAPELKPAAPSAAELRDGLRMLLERGVLQCRPGARGTELRLMRSDW